MLCGGICCVVECEQVVASCCKFDSCCLARRRQDDSQVHSVPALSRLCLWSTGMVPSNGTLGFQFNEKTEQTALSSCHKANRFFKPPNQVTPQRETGGWPLIHCDSIPLLAVHSQPLRHQPPPNSSILSQISLCRCSTTIMLLLLLLEQA